MSDAALPDSADIPIQLDGQDFVLKPSLGACITISKIGGGLNAAVQRCHNLDFETVCTVIVAALALNPTQAKQIPDMVFKTGIANVAGACIAFIELVANGGKPFNDEEDQNQDPLKPA